MLPACRRRGRSRCSLLVAVPVDVVCGLGLGGPQCCVASVSHVVLRGGRTHYHPLSAPNAKKRVGNQHWGPKRCLSTCAHAVYDSVRYTVYNYCNFQRKFAVERKMSYIRWAHTTSRWRMGARRMWRRISGAGVRSISSLRSLSHGLTLFVGQGLLGTQIIHARDQ